MSFTRFFEVLPGFLTWLTLAMMVILSWQSPLGIAIFIIVFDLYWLIRIIYLHIYLTFSFRKVRANIKINWLEKLEAERLAWDNLYHLVILPMFREPHTLARESFGALVNSNYPVKDKMIVVLAVEERGGVEAKETAEKIRKEFGDKFFKFLLAVHPANIPEELAGKGANESWAAKEVKQSFIDPAGIPYEKIMVSIFDIDTQVPPDYFSRLAYVFLKNPHALRSSYQPVPFFTNNIYSAPAFSRVMAFFPTFWQMMQQPRPDQLLTFSSQSIPFQALVDVGFWTTKHVSEDSLIFWQCYDRYGGDWRAIPLFYPVTMDATQGATFWESAKNLYKQQRRWAWGVENIPFMMEIFRRNKKIPTRKKISWLFLLMEGFWSWSTASLLIFFLGWLPLILGGTEFNATLLSYNLPRTTSTLMTILNVGIALSATLSTMLLPPKPAWFKKRHYAVYILQWILTPLILLAFSAIPAIEAQTRLMLGGKFRLGFWVTPKTRQ